MNKPNKPSQGHTRLPRRFCSFGSLSARISARVSSSPMSLTSPILSISIITVYELYSWNKVCGPRQLTGWTSHSKMKVFSQNRWPGFLGHHKLLSRQITLPVDLKRWHEPLPQESVFLVGSPEEGEGVGRRIRHLPNFALFPSFLGLALGFNFSAERENSKATTYEARLVLDSLKGVWSVRFETWGCLSFPLPKK